LAELPKVSLAVAVLLIGLKVISCVKSWILKELESTRPLRSRSKQLSMRSIEGMCGGSGSEDSDVEDDSFLERSDPVDPTFIKFAISLASNGLKALLLISVASILGISTTSFVAVLSMSSLAIGLALQGLLKDLAAGVMLLVFRKYDVGDLVDIAGVFGKVAEIALFETVVRSPDNKTISIPNSQVNVITNLSAQATIRADVALKIGHDTGLRAAKDVLLRLVRTSPKVLQDPAPQVLVSQVDELGKELTMRVWLDKADYTTVPFAIREEAVLALEDAGLALSRWPAGANMRGK